MDDTEVAAKCAVYAGDYEGVAVKHLTVRGPEVCADRTPATATASPS